jgi:hypothetical protein
VERSPNGLKPLGPGTLPNLRPLKSVMHTPSIGLSLKISTGMIISDIFIFYAS